MMNKELSRASEFLNNLRRRGDRQKRNSKEKHYMIIEHKKIPLN